MSLYICHNNGAFDSIVLGDILKISFTISIEHSIAIPDTIAILIIELVQSLKHVQ